MSGIVSRLAVRGDKIYAGGAFTSVGGVDRQGIAALDRATGALKDWNPNADGQVHTIVVSGTTVYVGGSFAEIGGQPRENLAALRTSDATATSWNPGAGGGPIRHQLVWQGLVLLGPCRNRGDIRSQPWGQLLYRIVCGFARLRCLGQGAVVADPLPAAADRTLTLKVSLSD